MPNSEISPAASLEPPLLDTSAGRRLAAEGLGTALLLAIVIGSGIMGDRLAGGNTAIALLGNTLATGAGLVVLITMFGPLSGAHFNPAVTLAFALRREISPTLAAAYMAVQVAGAIIGVWTAHLMFAEPLLQISQTDRSGGAQDFSEGIATFGLVLTILAGIRVRAEAVPVMVGLYITAAYWFTASTSFANPAVTIARALSDTFAGIAPASVLPFIAAQIAGSCVAVALFAYLFRDVSPAQRENSRAR